MVLRIQRALDSGTAVLYAAAGFGKTMALERVVEQFGGNVAWVRCGSGEGSGILIPILAAIERAVPGAAEMIDARSRELGAVADPIVTADRLLAELDAVLVDPLLLVLDDAEQLIGDEVGLAVLERIALGRPGRLRVAIASRQVLPLKVGKAHAAAHLTIFGAADLAFTLEETAELIAVRSGTQPSSQTLEQVAARTEGWPLAVAMSTMGAASSGWSIDSFDEDLAVYLREELLDRLDPVQRAAVLRSSLVESLPPAAAEAVGLPPAGSLGQGGDLLLREVPDAPGELRWHPLVREVLERQARRELSAEDRSAAQAALAAALSESGRRVEAVEQWLAAERWQEAAATLHALDAAVARVPAERIRGWLELLPEEVRNGPEAGMAEGHLLIGAGEPYAAVDALKRAEAGFERAGDVRSAWLARRLLIIGLQASGRAAELPELARGFDEDGGLEGGYSAPAVAVAAALVLVNRGAHDEADDLVARARRHPSGRQIEPPIEAHYAWAEFAAGNIGPALLRLEAATAHSDHDPIYPLLVALARLAEMQAAAGYPERALTSWRRIGEIGRTNGVDGFVDLANIGQALIEVQEGRLGPARVALARVATGPPMPFVDLPDRVRAVLGQRGDDTAMAEEAAARAVAIGRFLPITLRLANTWSLVPALVGLGQREEAEAVLRETSNAWDATFPGERGAYVRARNLSLRAWMADQAGRGEASELLGSAWAQAGAALPDLVRSEWPRLRDLVRTGIESGTLDADRTFAAIERAWPDGSALAELVGSGEQPEIRRRSLAFLISRGHPLALREPDEAGDDDEEMRALRQRTLERLRQAPQALSYSVLGHFSVSRGGWELSREAWPRPIAARLVRLLLANQGTPVSEDTLFEWLWPGKDSGAARRNLHVAVSQARSVLDVPGAEKSVIRGAERAYEIVLRDQDQLDANAFEQLAAAALAEDGPDRLTVLAEAVDLWRGEPLQEDRYADWGQPWRTRLFDRYQQVLSELAAARVDAGDPFGGIEAARVLLEQDASNEFAHRLIMRANVRLGRTAHALRQYLVCRRALIEELGVEPSLQTRELQRQILAGGPA